jgi:periplasmic protein TonB
VIAAPPEPARPSRVEQRARSPWPYRRRLWIAAGVALALHAALYLFSGKSLVTGVEFGMEEPAPSVDVELVEQAAPEPAPPAPPPPVPEPPKPEPVPEPPKPEPVPEPPKPDEMAPPKPAPTPKPKPAATPAPKPRAVAKPAVPSRPAPAATSSSTGTPGAAGRATGGRTSGPGHLYNPKPAHPPESRAAGENGTVVLRVRVEANGRPVSVTLARSSGYPRLDRAAQEAVRRWRFKPATRDGQAFAATVDVPVRFSLR